MLCENRREDPSRLPETGQTSGTCSLAVLRKAGAEAEAAAEVSGR